MLELRAKKVYINGKPLDEPYVHFLTAASAFSEVTSSDVQVNYGPVTVPPDQYFVMGDNRDNSQDSRYWGFLPRGHVKGKALMIYWSYEGDDMGSILTKVRWERLLHQIH
jgi:signal peptidase I